MGNILNYNVKKKITKEVSIMLKRALGLGLITSAIGLGSAISYANETVPSPMQMKQRLRRGKYQL
jgi:hypothetical protein